MVSISFHVHPYFGKWSNLTNILSMGWNHQLVIYWLDFWSTNSMKTKQKTQKTQKQTFISLPHNLRFGKLHSQLSLGMNFFKLCRPGNWLTAARASTCSRGNPNQVGAFRNWRVCPTTPPKKWFRFSRLSFWGGAQIFSSMLHSFFYNLQFKFHQSFS